MNAIQFGEMIINLDVVACMAYGEFEDKPSIEFSFSATIDDKEKGSRMSRTQVWFDSEKTRDVVFSLISDKVGAANLGDRACDAITKSPPF
jgi:hypothetical protein